LIALSSEVSLLPVKAEPNTRIELGFTVHEFNEIQGQMLGNSGSKWVRMDVDDEVVPSMQAANGYRRYGQQVLAILNEWSIKSSIRQTFSLDDWKRTVTVAATKLKGQVQAYEIWNEPDLPEYHYGYMDGSPQHYVDMLKAAYTTIKSIDPQAIVVGGSIADPLNRWGAGSDKFIANILNLGARNYIDAFSIHLYYKEDWTVDYGTIVTNIATQTGKPVWVTETGETSAGQGKTEALQTFYLGKRFQQMMNCTQRPAVIIWYEFYDAETSGSSAYGVFAQGFTPKLSYSLFAHFANSTLLVRRLTSG